MEKIKFKPLSQSQIEISMDRLTRFKPTEEKYLRVFKDIILSNLIQPKYKKSELDVMPYEKITKFAETIFNATLGEPENLELNEQIRNFENKIFKNDQNVQKLLENNINFRSGFSQLEYERLANPTKKLVITEGITEEILLPRFAEFMNVDFLKNGIHLVSAGGKNQVVKMFYKISEVLKLPIYVLMDFDAEKNAAEIAPKLRSQDKIRLINKGEFEDILSLNLIKRTLNFELKNFDQITVADLKSDLPMVKILEEIFRSRGLHDFKKADFAYFVAKNINSANDLSSEIKEILEEIILL